MALSPLRKRLRKRCRLPAQLRRLIVRIEPPRGLLELRLRELWEYRELLYFFVWRDVKVRYKQTVIGVAWVILQPLMTMGVFTIFFGRLAKLPSEGLPYPVFYFAALVPWTYFAQALQNCTTIVVSQPARDHQSVFSAAGVAAGGGVLGPAGFCDRFRGDDHS